MLSCTRWARPGLTYLLLLMTADTVATETPAWAATSLIVAGRPADSPISFICFASSIGSDGSCPYGASSSDALTKHSVVSSRCSLEDGGAAMGTRLVNTVHTYKSLLLIVLLI